MPEAECSFRAQLGRCMPAALPPRTHVLPVAVGGGSPCHACLLGRQWVACEGPRALTGRPPRTPTRHYDIRRNDDIINFFNDFSDHLAEEALWELSLKIKPRNIARRKTDREEKT